MQLRKGRDPAVSAFLYWSAHFKERKRGMDTALLWSPCRPPPPIPAHTCTSLFIMSAFVRQSCVSFVGEGEGRTRMTRRTHRWPTDLHILCGSEVIQPSKSKLCQWDLLFPNWSSMPGRSDNKQESSEYTHLHEPLQLLLSPGSARWPSLSYWILDKLCSWSPDSVFTGWYTLYIGRQYSLGKGNE